MSIILLPNLYVRKWPEGATDWRSKCYVISKQVYCIKQKQQEEQHSERRGVKEEFEQFQDLYKY
jgi:hypothetical protein